MENFVYRRTNVVKSRKINVSSADFVDEKGFFFRVGTAGNLNYVPILNEEFGTVSGVIVSGTPNVATLVLNRSAAAHISVGDKIYILGLTATGLTGLNGLRTVTSVDGANVSFATTESVVDSTPDTGGKVYLPILKAVDASSKFDDPELARRILSTDTTASNIFVGYGV